MSEYKVMTLSLSVEEMESLELMSDMDEVSKAIVIRKAIRAFHFLQQRRNRGERLFVNDVTRQFLIEVVLA